MAVGGLAQPEILPSGTGKRIAIVHTTWNAPIVNSLVSGARDTLTKCGCEDIRTHNVPGSYELPFACNSLAKEYDAVIAVGVLIKGDTMHFEYIAEAVTQGLMRVQLDTGVPVIFGVLTCLNEDQAMKRAGVKGGHNHGNDWGFAALQMTEYK